MLTFVEIAGQGILILFALCVQVMFIASLVACARARRSALATAADPPGDPLPFVTTMLAAYKEPESLARTCRRYQSLRYPRGRFELLILTEADDVQTNAVAAKLASAYPNVRREIVPADYLGPDEPHTKPRALKYGLSKLGPHTEVVGVLDAEDLVGQDMLLRVAEGIRDFPIVQGRLAIKNARENLLSYWFGAEYALTELLQRGRDLLGWMKFPRGTTYFVRRDVMEQIGWSTRNVTEDLAFNIKAYARGHATGLIDTTTWEESPLRLGVWFRQRTRWLQGALQTLRERIDLSRLGPMQRFSVWQVIYHNALVPLLCAIMLPLLIYDVMAASILHLAEPICTWPAFRYVWTTGLLLLGLIVLESMIATIVCYHGHRDLPKRVLACLLLPVMYMTLLPAAAVRAYWRQMRGRRNWEKTTHRGETRRPDFEEVPDARVGV